MKLKLYHAAAAAAIALSVMLLTACGSPKQADPLPIIKLRTVGSSSEAACQRIGEALSELTAEKFGFTVEISQQSTTNYKCRTGTRTAAWQRTRRFLLYGRRKYVQPSRGWHYRTAG